MTLDLPDPAAAPHDVDLVAVSAVTRTGHPVTVNPHLSWPVVTQFGSSWQPKVLIEAYRAGLFPMPLDVGGDTAIGWWSPAQRAVFDVGGLRVTRSLRAAMRMFTYSLDHAFDEVVAACGDPRREHGWIDADVRAAYRQLHRLGLAHSVEVWRDGHLAGGLYGVSVGGVFAGESMFHRERDASKAALVVLDNRLALGGTRVIDTQWLTPHLVSLGARPLDRCDYLALLATLRDLPASW